MFWNRKHQIKPSALAEALLSDFLPAAKFNAAKMLSLDPPTAVRVDNKAFLYQVALLLLTLLKVERKVAGFLEVRKEFERSIYAASPEAGGTSFSAVTGAMLDLNALFTKRKENSWARNWLGELGIDENNPIRLARFGLYFMDFQITAFDTLRSFNPQP